MVTKVKHEPNHALATLNCAQSSALATLVHNILTRAPNAPPTTPISSIFLSAESHATQRLTNQDLLRHLRRACTLLGGHTAFGFSSAAIGTRSLRSGAAMALFLAGHPPANIMLLGPLAIYRFPFTTSDPKSSNGRPPSAPPCSTPTTFATLNTPIHPTHQQHRQTARPLRPTPRSPSMASNSHKAKWI